MYRKEWLKEAGCVTIRSNLIVTGPASSKYIGPELKSSLVLSFQTQPCIMSYPALPPIMLPLTSRYIIMYDLPPILLHMRYLRICHVSTAPTVSCRIRAASDIKIVAYKPHSTLTMLCTSPASDIDVYKSTQAYRPHLHVFLTSLPMGRLHHCHVRAASNIIVPY